MEALTAQQAKDLAIAKPWYKSRGITGGAGALLSSLALALLALVIKFQPVLASNGLDGLALVHWEDWGELLIALTGASSAVRSIIGRLNATQPIG